MAVGPADAAVEGAAAGTPADCDNCDDADETFSHGYGIVFCGVADGCFCGGIEVLHDDEKWSYLLYWSSGWAALVVFLTRTLTLRL